MRSLSDRDKEVRMKFCCQFQGILTANPERPNNLLMSDETHFHLRGTVNKQNFPYWSPVKPYELHQRPRYDPKLPFDVLFGPEESLDATTLGMKTDKPSESHHSVTQR
jgi:hypothetical protein